MASVQNFALTAGEDQTLTMTARGASGAILDLTSAGISWRMIGRTGNAVLSKTGTIVSASAGTFTVSLTDADTSGFRDGNYTHEALITISGTTTRGVSGRIRVSGQKALVTSTSFAVPEDTGQLYATVAEVNAATIRADVSWIRTAGYYSAGDGGGALYKRVGSAPSHNGYITSNSGTAYWELESNSILNVRQFGAKGDNSQDDTTFINYAFAYIRAKTFEVTETEPQFQVYFPYGKYKTTGPINATGIRTRVWQIVGPGEIEATFDGGVVLDLTFSRFCTVRDLHISTASGSTPDIGILIGRESNGYVADDHHFQNVHVVGVFANSCLYNYASEDFLGINCSFLNDSSSTSAYCIRLDGTNAGGATSTFQTMPANTAASFNSVVFMESDCRRANGGPCLYVARSDGHRFVACYMATTTFAVIHINTTSAIFNRDLYLDVHFETSGMDSCIRFDGDASQTINGLTVIDYNPFCSDEVLKSGSGVTSITLINPTIKIRNTNNGVAPTNGLFSTASVFKFKKPDISYCVANTVILELKDRCTLGASGVAVPLTGTTSETVLATVPIYANIMGANGALVVTSYWSVTNNANNKTLQVRVGTTGNGLTGSIWGSTTQTAVRSMRMQHQIHNRNATNSQVLMNGIGTGGWGTTIQVPSTDTLDTTQALDLVFTGTLGNSADTIQLESYDVQLILP